LEEWSRFLTKRGIKNESFARWKLFVNAWLLHRALGVLLIQKEEPLSSPWNGSRVRWNIPLGWGMLREKPMVKEPLRRPYFWGGRLTRDG